MASMSANTHCIVEKHTTDAVNYYSHLSWNSPEPLRGTNPALPAATAGRLRRPIVNKSTGAMCPRKPKQFETHTKHMRASFKFRSHGCAQLLPDIPQFPTRYLSSLKTKAVSASTIQKIRHSLGRTKTIDARHPQDARNLYDSRGFNILVLIISIAGWNGQKHDGARCLFARALGRNRLFPPEFSTLSGK